MVLFFRLKNATGWFASKNVSRDMAKTEVTNFKRLDPKYAIVSFTDFNRTLFHVVC